MGTQRLKEEETQPKSERYPASHRLFLYVLLCCRSVFSSERSFFHSVWRGAAFPSPSLSLGLFYSAFLIVDCSSDVFFLRVRFCLVSLRVFFSSFLPSSVTSGQAFHPPSFPSFLSPLRMCISLVCMCVCVCLCD